MEPLDGMDADTTDRFRSSIFFFFCPTCYVRHGRGTSQYTSARTLICLSKATQGRQSMYCRLIFTCVFAMGEGLRHTLRLRR